VLDRERQVQHLIRRALNEGGELSAVIELRRHFPGIADNAMARICVRTIAGWGPVPTPKKGRTKSATPRMPLPR
jgi:hypothetical protein